MGRDTGCGKGVAGKAGHAHVAVCMAYYRLAASMRLPCQFRCAPLASKREGR